MKTIAFEAGQSAQLFISDEVNSSSGVYIPELISAVRERYGFVKTSEPTEVIGASAGFEHGQISLHNRRIVINELSIFNDGVIAKARDTDDADIILDDVISWLTERYKFTKPQTAIQRRYVSTLIVEFEVPLDNVLRPFNDFMKLLSGTISRALGRDVPVTAHRVSFSVDSRLAPPPLNTEFIIERRVMAIGNAMNRYFCVAPIQTKEHIQALEEFERVAVRC